jgi:hypothetical protein
MLLFEFAVMVWNLCLGLFFCGLGWFGDLGWDFWWVCGDFGGLFHVEQLESTT